MRRKRKKTLLQVARELVVETDKLALVTVRSRADMLRAAMKLEAQREPQPRNVR